VFPSSYLQEFMSLNFVLDQCLRQHWCELSSTSEENADCWNFWRFEDAIGIIDVANCGL
jgi:hypothetical protein